MYRDRLGLLHTPNENDIIKPRQGIFAIIKIDNQVLVTAGPHAPDVPELPGGGIDEGENKMSALTREIYEETGKKVSLPFDTEERQYSKKFYADDLNEYWDYDMTYVLIESFSKNLLFKDKKTTPEGGLAWWQTLSDLNEIDFRMTDKEVLIDFGLI